MVVPKEGLVLARTRRWGDIWWTVNLALVPSGYLAQRDWIVGALGNDSSLLDGYSASIIIGSAKNF
jgi:hypothetical protein